MVLVVASFACTEVGEVINKFDGSDPFDHLETELILATQPQWRTMKDAKWRPIHLIGEDRQRVAHIFDGMNIVVTPAISAISERVEHSITGLRCRVNQIEEVAHPDTAPFGDA